MAHFTRRSALTIIAAGGASIASGRGWAEDKPGRVIYPVAVQRSPTMIRRLMRPPLPAAKRSGSGK